MSIEFLDPTHENHSGEFALAPRLSTLEGAVVAIVSNGKKGSIPFFDAFEQALVETYGAAEVVRITNVIVREKAPAVCAWIDRMRAPNPSPDPDPATPDAIPDTILAVLRHLGRDYVPVLATAMPLLQAELSNGLFEDIPRYAGKHRFTMGRGKPYEAEGVRSIHTFEQWKVQRVLDVYESYSPDVQDDLWRLCEEIEAASLLSLSLPNRLERRGYKLVRAQPLL